MPVPKSHCTDDVSWLRKEDSVRTQEFQKYWEINPKGATMKTENRFITCLLALVFTTAMALSGMVMPASGATTPGIPGYQENSDTSNVFELDRNAVDDDSVAGEGISKDDDWSNVLNSGGATHGDFSIITRTQCTGSACNSAWPGVLVDPFNASIFVQGSKDLSNITSWVCRDQSAPDKDELNDAFAVAYNINGDLVVFLGADRYDNAGTATMGFWLLQADIAPPACIPAGDGKFRNSLGAAVSHSVGDLLIVADFTNGGAIGTVRVFEWVGSGGSEGSLDLLFEADPTKPNYDPKIDCAYAGNTLGDICGTINQVATTSPWNYVPKGANADSDFIQFGFMEIGVNLTRVFSNLGGEVPCFSTFVAETRSSSEPNAAQKDFVMGSFNVCSIGVNKVCGRNTPNLSVNPIQFVYDVGGCLDNTGSGSVSNFGLTDLPAFDASTLKFYKPASKPSNSDCESIAALEAAVAGLSPISTSTILQPGDRVVWLAKFTSTSNGPSDTVTATAQGSGGATIEPATDTATCPAATFNPKIKVTKSCTSFLDDIGSSLVAKVTISGYVCNIGDVPLNSVTVVDSTFGGNPGNIPTPILNAGTLPKNTCPFGTVGCSPDCTGSSAQTYSFTYTPNTIPTTPQGVAQRFIFKDDVTATGTPPTGAGSQQSDTAHAECALCPGCGELACPAP